MTAQSFLDTLMISDTNSLGILDIFFSLLIPFILSIPVVIFYKKTSEKLISSPGFLTSLLLFSPLTSVITLLIGSNIARAFGLVAALSIIRFRTALKATIDSIYLFWVLTIGMACGTGYYLAAVLIVVMGILFVFISHFFKLEEYKFKSLLINIDVPKSLNEEDLELVAVELEKSVKNPKRINTLYSSSKDHKRLVYSAQVLSSTNPDLIEKNILSLKNIKQVEILKGEAALFS
jgi:hypothetical protein